MHSSWIPLLGNSPFPEKIFIDSLWLKPIPSSRVLCFRCCLLSDSEHKDKMPANSTVLAQPLEKRSSGLWSTQFHGHFSPFFFFLLLRSKEPFFCTQEGLRLLYCYLPLWTCLVRNPVFWEELCSLLSSLPTRFHSGASWVFLSRQTPIEAIPSDHLL